MKNISSNHQFKPTPARLVPKIVQIIHEPASVEVQAQQVQAMAEVFARRLRGLDGSDRDKPGEVSKRAAGAGE